VAEECEILGAKALPNEWLEGLAAAVILDHSNPAEVVVGAPAKVALRITVHGVEGHAAMPERRVNAAHALARALARLPSGRLDPFSTANLGIMHAGTRINIIPGLAMAEYEIRSHRNDLLDHHLEATLAVIEAAVREARVYLLGDDLPADEDPVRKATVEVEVDRCYEAYRVPETALPVRILTEAIRAEGGEPALRVAAGGSDANGLNARGCTAVVYGCGMHGAHSVRETADLREMARAVCTLRRAVGAA
jgi:tripeptide aminopeptidase